MDKVVCESQSSHFDWNHETLASTIRQYGTYLHREGKATIIMNGLNMFAKHGPATHQVIEEFVSHAHPKVANTAQQILKGGAR